MSRGLDHFAERRILGGIELIDITTGVPICRPLRMRVDPHQPGGPGAVGRGVQLLVNRSSRYAILGADGLEAHVLPEDVGPDDVGIEAPRPGPGELGGPRTYRLRVDDPRRRYVPRRFVLDLPRDPVPAHVDEDDSIFQPARVEMLPSPVATGSPGWAALRARVHHALHPELGLPYAMLRVTWLDDGLSRHALGLADHRGEALVLVPDLPARDWASTATGPVSTPEKQCVVEAFFDPTPNPLGGSLAAALANVRARSARRDPDEDLVAPDPDELEPRRSALPRVTTTVPLQASQTRHVELAVPLDPF